MRCGLSNIRKAASKTDMGMTGWVNTWVEFGLVKLVFVVSAFILLLFLFGSDNSDTPWVGPSSSVNCVSQGRI